MMRVENGRSRDLGELADLLTGELTPSDAARVRDRIEHDDEFQRLAMPVLAAWAVDHAPLPPLSDTEAEAALVVRMAEIDHARVVEASVAAARSRRWWLAGPILGLTSAALFYVMLASVPTGRRLISRVLGLPADFALATAVGEERSIRLPDGSRVTIDPDSRLSYQHSYFEPAQLVVLQGAATFDVVPQGFRTFRVAAGRVFVQVEGTRFSVHAYPGEPETSVIVSRGRVKVAGPDFRDVEVDSGFVARVVGRRVEVRPIGGEGTMPTTTSSSWDGQQLRFDGVPLATVAAELRHWFGVEIRLADSDLGGRRVSASFAAMDSAGVAALCVAAHVRAERTREAISLRDANP